jgi:uncharacterized protein YecT (DUF1311 family)
MLKHLFVTTACATLATHAYADCTVAATDSERAQCIGQELRESDKIINQEYAHLRAVLDTDGQANLRRAEIAWIKERAATCQVDAKEADRERWLASVLADYSKTVCVVRLTERRVAELRAQNAALTQPAPPPQAAPSGEVYDVVSKVSPSTGKYYFEVTLPQGEIAQHSAASIFIGVHGAGASSAGTIQTIRPRNVGQRPINIGMAVDLDNGKLYSRFNGAWRDQPGSASGLDLKLGRPYDAKLSSSISVAPYLDSGALDVNFGQHPFAYALPDGFVALDPNGPRRVVEQ